MIRPFAGLLAMLAILATTAEASSEIRVYDARPLHGLNLGMRTNATHLWDTMHCISALQGLANRNGPRLYLLYSSGFGIDTDQFWLDWLRGRQPKSPSPLSSPQGEGMKYDGWLKGKPVTPLTSLGEAITTFRDCIKGLVVYDPNVRATSNLASTAAGCEDLLPVRFDTSPGSLYTQLRSMGLTVKLWLVQTNGEPLFTGKGLIPGTDVPSTGSAKTDAYVWASHRWIKTGKAAPSIAAYYIDSYWLDHPTRGAILHTLCNHDYYIARRAFFFDLSPWGDEPPNDDPSQPLGADKRVFLQIMRELYDHSKGGIIAVGGFVPWPHKYTSASVPPGKHEPVPSEWEFGLLISQFNGYMEADAAGLSDLCNASFMRHYPLRKVYPQKKKRPSKADWKRKGYLKEDGTLAPKLFVGHYVGDYDAPAWLSKAVPKMFPNNAAVPLGWAFNPNLADRAPQAMAYARAHAGSNDWFISGDSGAGYLNPRALTVRPDSGLPSGLKAWVRHCEKYYRQWDLTITGFMLDGSAGASTDTEYAAYKSFSPDGIGTHFESKPALKAGIPTCREIDLPDRADAAAATLARAARGLKGGTGFFWARSILKEPRWYDEVSLNLAGKHSEAPIEVVDPYTFFGLIAMHLQEPQAGR